MDICYTTNILPRDQFYALFETTGWNAEYRLTADELEQALRSSWYLVCAYDGDRLVGIGRMVSDGVVHAMIYDMIVDPAYQGQGIGTEILARLVEYCRSIRIRDIQLFCARGKRLFYEKNGFSARPDDAPGMQQRPSYGA